MQLRHSLLLCALLALPSMAEDYISVQFMGYDENSGETTISTPSIEINKDFGSDYTLNLTLIHDSVSGASPTWYDAFSGASAKLPEGVVYQHDITYGAINYEDKRKAVGVALTKRFASRDELTTGINYSDENDYTSKEVSFEYLHYLDPSKNRSITFGSSYQKNDVSIYCSLGNSVCDGISGASEIVKDLDVISSEIGFTQIIDKTSLFKTSLFYIHEDGYLSNPYMRVVRDYNTEVKITEENKPQKRTAYGITLNYTKALTEKLSSITNYRFYDDDWDISSHTLESELNYTINSRWSIGTGLRYYTQAKAEFYNGKKDYFTDQKYASSDQRVSDFEAVDYKLNLAYKLTKQVKVTMDMAYYNQPDWFDAIYYAVGIRYSY